VVQYGQRENILSIRLDGFLKISFIMAILVAGGDLFASQAPNPRGGGTVSTSTARSDGREIVRTAAGVADATGTKTAVSRTATRRDVVTVGRGQSKTVHPQNVLTNTVVSSRSAATPRAALSVPAAGGTAGTTSRAASGQVVRAAVNKTTGRTAKTTNVSRAATARATAVFDDVSKIGGGYAACREAYATCMDQFCAKANDTYRRCFCSAKYIEFRNTENALEQAQTLLMQFEDNNLNAVDKTAAEVNAMYSATVGELAIKKDTSAAANTLNEISDLLSGKKVADTSKNTSSLGILSLDFETDMDDIWNGGGSTIFDGNAGQNLEELEGEKLFNSANNQCLKIISDSCENNAVLTMARSAYNIMITQDCNAYEKKVNSQKEVVAKTVRQAEKVLRDARLEEYRAHNSADVNECLDKVRTAVTQDMACGANYKKCLDYSGVYIDTNGEAIYTPRLFELNDMIILDGSADVLGANPRFAQFLEDKKMFATSALDTCRDISDIVWTEFKRAALIEIAQAQDNKIEEVKSSCVSTMKECYDTQSKDLKSFDNTTAQYSGAAAAYAARGMCQEKVAACAALYAGPNDVQCQFDDKGRLTNGATCGLAALVSLVETVDNVRISEGCDTALTNYVNDLCTPEGSAEKYPMKCRTMTSDALKADLEKRADIYCKDPTTGAVNKNLVGEMIKRLIYDVESAIYDALAEVCEGEDINGLWVDPEEADGEPKEAKFYSDMFNASAPDAAAADSKERGYCIQNTVRYQCMAQDDATGGKGYATFDRASNTCKFTTEWYQFQCNKLNGYWENGNCYI